MARKEKHKCEECGKDSDTLYARSGYNHRTNNRFMCADCYEKIHGEPFEVEDKNLEINIDKGE